MKRYEFQSIKKHNIGSQGKRIFILTLLFFWFMGLHEHLPGSVAIPPYPVTLSWSGRHMTYMNASLNGKGNSLVVNPGEEVKITFNWQLKVDNGTIYCPGCIVQFYYGIKDTFSNCLFSSQTPPGFKKSDSVSATFKAPMASGVYYITQAHTLLYNCKPEPGKHSNDFKDAFAVITVRKNIHFLIKSRLNGYVLSIEKGSNKRGAPIVVYPQKGSGTDDQLWTVTEDGYIKSRLNDYVLDIQRASTKPGTPIIAYSQNPDGLNQQWEITNDGYIKSKLNGYVLDIKEGSTQPGTPIIAYPKNPGALNQQWDFSPAPICLGFPVNDAPVDARKISYLQSWQKKIYIGYGNWSSNSVIVSIRYYSPQDCQFHTEDVYYNFNHTTNPTTVDVAIDRYDIIDGDLYIPGTDPADGITGWRIGTFYRKDGSGWVMYNNIPRVAHNFDMIRYKTKLFAALGGTNTTCLQSSTDNGNTWQVAIDPLEKNQERFNHLFKIGGKLYAVARQYNYPRKVFRYNCSKGKFELTGWDLVPGNTSSYIFRLEVLDGKVFSIPASRDNIYMASPGSDGILLPKHNPVESLNDIKVANGLIYLLAAVQSESGYSVGICTINSSGYNVGHIGVKLPYEPWSMEVMEGFIYLGTVNGVMYAIPDIIQQTRAEGRN